MGGVLRLLVCGGLFVAGYYIGRQSYRQELEQALAEEPGLADAVADLEEAAARKREEG